MARIGVKLLLASCLSAASSLLSFGKVVACLDVTHPRVRGGFDFMAWRQALTCCTGEQAAWDISAFRKKEG
ncbi:hypothetical protein GGR56DRAFT_624925 [Xylariaceae sp. FL0804]|nr:hypothetical protein GGR56DRAFT_624925 [Xylariaceae sp. FL0804]